MHSRCKELVHLMWIGNFEILWFLFFNNNNDDVGQD